MSVTVGSRLGAVNFDSQRYEDKKMTMDSTHPGVVIS